MNTQTSQPDFNAQKAKRNIINIIIVVAVLLTVIIGLVLTKQYATKKQADKDKNIILALYDLRTEADAYYDANKSYKDWQANPKIIEQVKQLGSEVIVKKSGLQNYMFYAFIKTDNKYFCIDTTGFNDEITTVSNQQTKCQ